MEQLGEHYIVVNIPKNMDKWGRIVKIEKVEEPFFRYSKNMKLLNFIKVQLIKMDDPNLFMYVQESNKFQNCYFTRMLDLSTIQEEKTLYVYLEGTNIMRLNPIFLDKNGVLYEPMEQRLVWSFSWQGLLNLEFSPRTNSSIGIRFLSAK